jgi:hypothetical protein
LIRLVELRCFVVGNGVQPKQLLGVKRRGIIIGISVADLIGAVQCLSYDAESECGRIALARQHANQAPDLSLVGLADGTGQLALDQGQRRGSFGLGTELVDCRLDIGAGDPSPVKLSRKSAPPQAAAIVPGLNPGCRKGGIINQPDVGEPAQHCLSSVPRHTAPLKRVSELGPGARCRCQHPQADQPGDRLGISRRIELVSGIRLIWIPLTI